MPLEDKSTIAIIGVGEVGGCFASALASLETVLLCDIKQRGAPAETARNLGLPLQDAPGPWLAAADIVLVCTPGDQCKAVAAAVLAYLPAAAHYFDLSTAAPDDLAAAARNFQAAGRHYTDIAIMSSIQLTQEKSPLLVAGPGRETARAMFGRLGAAVNFVDGSGADAAQPGQATSLKLLRSIIIKGLECLVVEALTAAEKMGVRQQLMQVLSDLDEKPLADFFQMMLTTHMPHAVRRGHEMTEAAAQLEAMGFDALMTAMVPKRYEKTALAKQSLGAPDRVEDLQTSLKWLSQAARR